MYKRYWLSMHGGFEFRVWRLFTCCTIGTRLAKDSTSVPISYGRGRLFCICIRKWDYTQVSSVVVVYTITMISSQVLHIGSYLPPPIFRLVSANFLASASCRLRFDCRSRGTDCTAFHLTFDFAVSVLRRFALYLALSKYQGGEVWEDCNLNRLI